MGEVPGALRALLGRTGLPFNYVAEVFFLSFPGYAIFGLADAIQWAFSWLPNIVGLCSCLASCRIELRGLAECLLVFGTAAVVSLLWFAQDLLWFELFQSVLHSKGGRLGYACYMIFSAALTMALYWTLELSTAKSKYCQDGDSVGCKSSSEYQHDEADIVSD